MRRWPWWVRWSIRRASVGVLLVSIWLLAAPLAWGGDVAYVLLTGNSMRPGFHRGDLVVTRRTAVYRIGDIVLYRHPTIGYVFHRIVDRDRQGRFVLKGDHNAWLDGYHPNQAEILGRFVLRIPWVGQALWSLRRPWVVAALTLMVLLLLGAGTKVPRRTRRGPRRELGTMRVDRWTGWLLLCVVALLFGVGLGVVAFTRPLQIQEEFPIPYRHEVQFTYTAPAIPGVYDAEQVRPGEPVFHQLTGSLDVEARYRWQAEMPPADLTGHYRLLAQVRDGYGWRRTLELVPETPVEGPSFVVQASLDLDSIQRFIDLLEERTGVQRSTYLVNLILELDLRGTLGGVPFHDQWQPTLSFAWDRWELYLNTANNPLTPQQDPLHPVLEAQVVAQRWRPNVLILLGHALPVARARWMAVLLGGLGAIGLIALEYQMRRAEATGDPLTQMRLLYGPLLVPARALPPAADTAWLEVEDAEALARIAEQYQEVIFYREEDAWVHFWVQTPSGVFHRALPRRVVEVQTPPDTGQQARWPWQRARVMEQGMLGALRYWAQTVDGLYGDPSHSQRVAELSVQVARHLGVREDDIEHLRRAALLHDLGLSAVPVEILRKPEPLSDQERALVEAHTQRLCEYLAAVPSLAPALQIARAHHERWDGSGYPEGLQGEAIPLGARILAVVEVYDALVHDRPYRPAWPVEKALTYLERQAGQAFDPRVVAALIAVVRATTDDKKPVETVLKTEEEEA